MGHGFVSDPGELTSLATTVYRLKQKYGRGSGSGAVGLGGQATGGGSGAGPAAAHRLPVAAAVAPVGVLGAAGAAAWAVHRRRVQEREDAVEAEDDEL